MSGITQTYEYESLLLSYSCLEIVGRHLIYKSHIYAREIRRGMFYHSLSLQNIKQIFSDAYHISSNVC